MKEMCDDFIMEQTAVSTIQANRKMCPCQNGAGSTTGGTSNGNTTSTEMDCNAWLINTIGLSQAYVAPQPNANKITEEQSLVCGTAFSDLVQPYVQGSNLIKFS